MNKINTIIIDDDELLIIIMKKMLMKSNFYDAPSTFENGKLALDGFKSEYSTDQFYVIFLDINMPVMNGWEFLKHITEFASPNNTFVYIVTSSTDQADIELSKQFELVVDFLSKPVYVDKLQNIKAIIAEKTSEIEK